jgi:pimeloyl-ACP methyl ester carboxylesterase
MATRRQASLSAFSASSTSTKDMANGTAASTNHAYTVSTRKAAAAAATPVPMLPADIEDEQKGELLAGTHYILEGPATGKLVVCVPGLGGPHWYFDELVPFLLQAGFRVLRYDLVGRGHSEPPPRTRRPSCFCNGVAREKDPYGTFILACHFESFIKCFVVIG